MEAIKLEDLCAELGVERAKVDELRKKLGIKCHKRNNVWTITTDEAAVIRAELELPPQLQSDTYYAIGLHAAQNPHWFWCLIEGIEGKHPVQIPRRFWGKLTKKRFPIEKIEDANGITWRHEWFRNLANYG